MLDQIVDATFLYPIVAAFFIAVAELGTWLGLKFRGRTIAPENMGTLAVSALGLLALLLAFSLSHALSRYESRRDLVVEEAVAIGSTADLALMLPEQAQKPILDMLREYADVRVNLGIPYDPEKLERDAVRSSEILARIWHEAVAVADPQSLSDDRFINALDDLTKIQDRRVMARRYHVPDATIAMLLSVALVALGFTGYQAGLSGTRLRGANLLMAGIVAIVTVMVVDFDQPARGLIRVPADALEDVAKRIQP